MTVTGFALVDKASGWTSHDVVAKARGLFRMKKIGHAGTLDPMATGLLVLGLGRATRLLRFVQDAPKTYSARVQFGVATDSLDADGAVLERSPLPISEADLVAVGERFTGHIMQRPPMVSARKIDGRRLYELAREGKEVDREAREVTIHALDVVDFAPSDYPVADLLIRCSKGTYVRSLADDMARALGGRAHLTELRRERNGRLHVDRASTVEELEEAASAGTLDGLVLAPLDGLADLPEVAVGEQLAAAIANGVTIAGHHLGDVTGPVKISAGGRLLAVYRADGDRATAEVVLS